jgi:hypothetical protein
MLYTVNLHVKKSVTLAILAETVDKYDICIGETLIFR